jgi:glycogen debranching enzyme
MDEIIQRAFEIAKKDLRFCYSEDGIIAGLQRFDDYWARDSFFASLGSIELEDFLVVRKNFALFLKYQKADGQIARRLDKFYVLLKYLGLKIRRKKFKIKYYTAISRKPSTDQNSLFIIALKNYLIKSNDKDFVRNNFEKIKKAMDWNFSLDKDGDGLLEESFLANWEDTIFKAGKVIYTNALHYYALVSFIEILVALNMNADFYKQALEKVSGQIEKFFWNGHYYIGWIGSTIHKVFIADGNLLAIISGLADQNKSFSILEIISRYNKREDLIKNINFKYAIWRHSPIRILGMATGYHEKYEWLWLNCLLTQAQYKTGQIEKASYNLQKMAEIIVKFGHVYEIYKHNIPIKSRFFVTEVPFAWSAGLFIYTAKMLNQENLVDKI